jgi:hypothetical protein
MDLKNDDAFSNIVSFPEPSPDLAFSVDEQQSQEGIVTIEGLLLMRAFFKIAASEDRKKVIALAERLGQRDGRAAKD